MFPFVSLETRLSLNIVISIVICTFISRGHSFMMSAKTEERGHEILGNFADGYG